MKKVLLLILFMMIILGLNAEKVNFDLTKYKAPEIKRKSLELDFDLSNTNSDNESSQSSKTTYFDSLDVVDYETIGDYPHQEKSNSSSFYFRSYFNHSFSKKLSESNLDAHFGFHSGLSKREYSSSRTFTEISEESIEEDISHNQRNRSSKNIDNYLEVDYSKNNYFFEKGLYFEYGAFLGLTYSYNNSDELRVREESRFYYNTEENTYSSESYSYDKKDSDYIGNSYNIEFNPSITLGFGKIDNVYDARLAVYILQSLEDYKSLKTIPNDELIIEFAALITKINNERFIDSRDRAIYEFETLMNFLTSKDLVTTNNMAKVSALLYDNWKFLRYSDSKFSYHYYNPYSSGDYPFNKSYSGRRNGNKLFFTSSFIFERDADNCDEERIEEENGYEINSLVSKDSLNRISDIHRYNKDEFLGFSMRFTDIYSKPIGLDWQIDINHSLGYEYIDFKKQRDTETYSTVYEYEYTQIDSNDASISDITYTETDNEYDTEKDYQTFLEYNFWYSFSYMFNYRTYFTGYLSGNYFTQAKEVKELFHNDSQTIYDRTEIGLNSKYYISPKLYLSGLVSYSYSFNKISDNDIITIYYDSDVKPAYQSNSANRSSYFRIKFGLNYTIF
ncbi:MAG: hypothetical protein K8S23_11090 [Candidatus Cloacimonetes bacterium]|nr:hypothetical protein [Candidatus Cloacimonadota bacterium]